MIGAGTIQAMLTSLKSNRIRGRWRKPFSRKIKRKGTAILRWKKASPELLKAIRSKIKKQNRIENLMYIGSVISVTVLVNWVV